MTRTKVTNSSLAFDGGPLSGFRNAIINGNFDIWQRGTSFTGSVYGADRWINSVNGSSCTMSRQPFTLGQTDVPEEPTYFCRMVVSSVSGAGNFARLLQRIEDVRTYAGQQATLSFWAKANISRSVYFELVQIFGSGGSPSSSVIITGPKVSLTTAWQKFTHTFTIPSIAGKTLGTDSNSNLELAFWFDAGSDFNSRTSTVGQQSGTFEIAQVQIEAGPVATPFERRPIGTELTLCQRYYQWNVSTQGAMNEANNRFVCPVGFTVPMRATPNVSIRSGGNAIHRPGIAFINLNSIAETITTSYLTCSVSSNYGANLAGQMLQGAVQYSAEL
jgi:hypothetical protein